MLVLGARRRGLGWIIYLFIKGISRGDPLYIGIAVGLVLLIAGYAYYKFRSNKANNDNTHEPTPSEDAEPIAQLGDDDIVEKP